MAYGYYGYAPQMTQGELKAKALRLTKPGYAPVVIDGKEIAVSWWGRSWCDNIDRYVQLPNRMSKGKSYVKGNAVIDLSVTKGIIRSKVIGTRPSPYDVTIRIDPVGKENYENLLKVCSGKLESLSMLEKGEFPKEYQELFTAEGKGLFPSRREIHFNCACPDHATVCKHVTATLYAVGRRLDDSPLLLLELRGIEIGKFTDAIIRKETARLWGSMGKEIDKSRMMGEEDAMRLFGFERPPLIDEAEYTAMFRLGGQS